MHGRRRHGNARRGRETHLQGRRQARESSRARSRLEYAVADARGLLAGSTADQYKVPYLYRRLEQLTEQAAGLLDDGSASPADMDRLSQGIGAMVASLASGTR